MSSSPTVQVDPFFLEWLPQRFTELAEKDPTLGQTECSLLAVVGDAAFTLNLGGGKLSVVSGKPDPAPTFRLHADEAGFQHLVGAAMQATTAEPSPDPRALKLLRLDAETVNLAASIPACVKLCILSAESTHELVFGPGAKSDSDVGCTVECPADDLELLRQGAADPIELFMSGRLKVDGDLQVAMALSSVLL